MRPSLPIFRVALIPIFHKEREREEKVRVCQVHHAILLTFCFSYEVLHIQVVVFLTRFLSTRHRKETSNPCIWTLLESALLFKITFFIDSSSLANLVSDCKVLKFWICDLILSKTDHSASASPASGSIYSIFYGPFLDLWL